MLISATHTHSASSALGQDRLKHEQTPDEYQKFVAQRIADGVQRAVNNLRPAELGFGTAEAPEHVFNRRWYMKPGTVPDAKLVAEMMKYNESLQRAGVLLALDGLHPPSMGARVTFKGGKPVVTDGPYAEAKEVVGGYWMIQVRNKDEAIAWAKRCPASENETIEIRQVMELSDFPYLEQKGAQ